MLLKGRFCTASCRYCTPKLVFLTSLLTHTLTHSHAQHSQQHNNTLPHTPGVARSCRRCTSWQPLTTAFRVSRPCQLARRSCCRAIALSSRERACVDLCVCVCKVCMQAQGSAVPAGASQLLPGDRLELSCARVLVLCVSSASAALCALLPPFAQAAHPRLRSDAPSRPPTAAHTLQPRHSCHHVCVCVCV